VLLKETVYTKKAEKNEDHTVQEIFMYCRYETHSRIHHRFKETVPTGLQNGDKRYNLKRQSIQKS
jgi:hypothetical protein